MRQERESLLHWAGKQNSAGVGSFIIYADFSILLEKSHKFF